MNRLELFNDLIVSLAFYILTGFSDMNDSLTSQYNTGFAMIALVVFGIFTNMYFVIREMCYQARLVWLRFKVRNKYYKIVAAYCDEKWKELKMELKDCLKKDDLPAAPDVRSAPPAVV